MSHRKVNSRLILPEVEFATARSGGPGGQNVNKVNSKVHLRFNIPVSRILTDEEKSVLLAKLHARISSEGVLLVVAQAKRSQTQNKEEAIAKLDELLEKAFRKKKIRRPTKPSKASVQKRITSKKQHSEKKSWRRKSGF